MKNFLALTLMFLTALVSRADVSIDNLPLGTAAATTSIDVFPFVNNTIDATQKMTVWDIINLPPMVSTYAPIANPTFTGVVDTPALIVSGQTANTVPYLNSGEELISSAATPAQLGYLSNSTSNLCGINQSCTETNKTLTAPVISTIVNTGTLTLPTSTDTLVGRATTDTLTNKTLTAPVISTIVNTGTLTLPTSTDTLVGRATTDTLTNKTLTSPTITGTGAIAGVFTGGLTGNVTGNVSGNAGTVTTNANMTGPITGTGNVTSITAQTGTGTTFVMSAAPTISGTVTLSGITTPGSISANSSGVLSAGPTYNVVSKTTTYTATISDQYIEANGSAFTITMPAATAKPGQVIAVEKTDASLSNIITISGAGSDTLGYSGATSLTLNTQGETLRFTSDGTSTWRTQRSIPSVQTAFTVTNSQGFGTLTSNTTRSYWQRVGNMMRITARFSTGTVSGTEGRIQIPGGLSTDSSVYQFPLGTGGCASTSNFFVSAPATAPYLNFYLMSSSGTSFMSPQNASTICGSSGDMGFEAMVPISGWAN